MYICGKCIINVGLLLMIISFTNIYGAVEKITYISVEHPRTVFFDPKYLTYVNLTSNRYGRANPVYYVGLHFNSLFSIDNNVKAAFYFYELLSNQYKPSFVQMFWRWCDLLHKDTIFGAALKQGKFDGPCPYPPGEYHLWNMTINPDVIPRGFPFTKGRIYANISLVDSRETIASVYIDMELRQLKVTDRIKNKKL